MSLIEAQAVAVRFSHRQIMAAEVATTLNVVPFEADCFFCVCMVLCALCALESIATGG